MARDNDLNNPDLIGRQPDPHRRSADGLSGDTGGAPLASGLRQRDGARIKAGDSELADNDDVISTLNTLLESCRDGEYGFGECAQHCQSPDLKMRLQRYTTECRAAGQELQMHIEQLGGKADEGGSISGALHRGWVSVRGKLAGYNDVAMLDECERGEDAALGAYRKALKENLPPAIQAVVVRQADGAQRNHDEVKALRDALKATR